MEKNPKKQVRQRIFVIQILLVGCICLLVAKSFEVQIFKARDLTQKAEQGYSKYLTIKGERGQILDRHLSKLGTSIDAPTITADPSKILDPARTARDLSRILKVKPKVLKEKLSRNRRFVMVAEKVSPAQAKRIRTLNIQGIYLENDSKRFYPNRNLAAQVIGFTGKDDSGLEGLEFKYNPILEGEVVKIKVKRDGAGRVLDINKKRRSELKGNSLVLTIDKKIQFLSEQTLEQTVKTHQAKSGMALVMKPSTGELLAMAHYPGFNPNNFSASNRDTFRNRSITDAFEPGSVIKVFTVAAALENGFTPKSIFFCENGKYRIGRFTIHDTHPREWLSLNQIIKFSSNIGVTKISETIGKKALHDYLTDFGFGLKTGVGCPGETNGTLLSPGKWSKIDAGAISFGQGLSVSAIQLISGVCTIANDGKLMKPMLIKKIISNTGNDIQVFQPTQLRQVVSTKTADQVKTMMNLVVQEEGTGTMAAMEGYRVCGKTSTAQKANKSKTGYEKNKYIAAFAGFAPQENPELAILVVIDEPKKQHYGGEVAAPAFKTIMAQSFSYLNIAPENTKSMIAAVTKGEIN
ncbi:MAG: penicillin-binding protein 2 [Desulfobacteraceae bacterium]|nr:penicillin-binding protein 2 [Desulfobacteraceae bacterium]